jgi:hypothetical protein
MTPNGPIAPADLTFSTLSPYRLQVNFPLQTAVGNYSVTVGPQIVDLYGRPMAQAFTGTFTISLPAIQGTITDTNGHPMPGVVLQQSTGYSAATTDTNGNYALSFAYGQTVTVQPVATNLIFLPGSRTYTNLIAAITNENYLAVTSIAPSLTGGIQGTNLLMSWQGLPGVTYQLYYSTNMFDWLPYGDPITGSNTVLQVPIPIGSDPMEYFKVQANN